MPPNTNMPPNTTTPPTKPLSESKPRGLPDIFRRRGSDFQAELRSSAEDPLDKIVVPSGEKNITVTHGDIPDPVPNGPKIATTFFFNRQDHTLANLLVMQLRKNPMVEFAAYKMVYPDLHSFELRVHMMPGPPPVGSVIRIGSGPWDDYTAEQAITDACLRLVKNLDKLNKHIMHEWLLYKVAADENFEAGTNTSALGGVAWQGGYVSSRGTGPGGGGSGGGFRMASGRFDGGNRGGGASGYGNHLGNRTPPAPMGFGESIWMDPHP